MPITESDLWAWFFPFSMHFKERCTFLKHPEEAPDTFATIEQVQSLPRDGRVGAFSFGKSYGLLIMALTAAQIPYEQVRPQDWQKGMGIKPRDKGDTCPQCKGKDIISTCPTCNGKKKVGGESETQWKNRLKAKAQQLFPQEKVTLATADALLIAEFGRRRRSGTL